MMELLSILANILLSIGAITTLSFTYKLYRFLTFHFHTPALPLQAYKRADTTAWALISGSSAGIGFGLASHLLSLNFGVIIFAHEGVDEAVAKLQQSYPNGKIKSFTFDCMTATIADISNLVSNLKDLKITILINNVGSIPLEVPIFRHFKDFSVEGIDNTINLNARFATHLTRLMIPVLQLNAAPRSLILNLSSGGRVGLPYSSIYAATKAYNSSFSTSISREFRLFNYPIDCLAIVPGDVLTSGNSRGMQPGSPTAAQFAREIVGKVDTAVARGMVEMAPYWVHAVQMAIMDGWLWEGRKMVELGKVMGLKKEAWEKVQ